MLARGAPIPRYPAAAIIPAVLTPPAYRARLRLEGIVLVACGAIGTIVLLVASSKSTQNLGSAGIQWLVVAALLLWFGPRGVRRSVGKSDELHADAIGSGEPTPLWHIAAIVIVLTLIAGLALGWNGGLRVTVGCMLVGATQALILAPMVNSNERTTRRTYYRVKGSRILRGTRLGYVPES
jgi:hypothetical protein